MAKEAAFDKKVTDNTRKALIDDSIVDSTLNKGQDGSRQQRKASPEEVKRRLSELKTQGKKGCKLPRVNFAISPENLLYAKSIAARSGINMTMFINRLIDEHKENHPDLLKNIEETHNEVMGLKKKKK